jgi:hypothetical protein
MKGHEMKNAILVLLFFAVTTSCSSPNDVPAAERAIASFHSDLNAAKFDKIYNTSGPQLKSTANEEQFVTILQAVHSKLGPFIQGKTETWFDNVGTDGHKFTANYEAHYRNGVAHELFVYRLNRDQISLTGYQINSNAL